MQSSESLVRRLKNYDRCDEIESRETLFRISLLGLFVIGISHLELTMVVGMTKKYSSDFLGSQLSKGRITDIPNSREYVRKLTNRGTKVFNHIFSSTAAKNATYTTIVNIKRLQSLPEVTMATYGKLRNMNWDNVNRTNSVKSMISDGWIDDDTLMFTDQTVELFLIVKEMQLGKTIHAKKGISDGY